MHLHYCPRIPGAVLKQAQKIIFLIQRKLSGDFCSSMFLSMLSVYTQDNHHHHHHHYYRHELWKLRRIICSLTLKVKLVLPSFLWGFYIFRPFWFMEQCVIRVWEGSPTKSPLGRTTNRGEDNIKMKGRLMDSRGLLLGQKASCCKHGNENSVFEESVKFRVQLSDSCLTEILLHESCQTRSAFYWNFSQRKLVVYYGRFGTANWSQLQGSYMPSYWSTILPSPLHKLPSNHDHNFIFTNF
jgi:hypothetical protein